MRRFGLDKETDIDGVLSALKKLARSKGENEIEEAGNLNIITVAEEKLYMKMLRNGQTEVLQVVAERKAEFESRQRDELTALYNANYEKIVTYLGAGGWEEIRRLVQNGLPYETVKKIVNNLPERIYLASAVVKMGGELQDLDWYRKNNPKALRDNPELYQSLLNVYKKRK
jgi:hypothetical protein